MRRKLAKGCFKEAVDIAIEGCQQLRKRKRRGMLDIYDTSLSAIIQQLNGLSGGSGKTE
jgi:hypothetical protein